jgi:hypothetical protein
MGHLLSKATVSLLLAALALVGCSGGDDDGPAADDEADEAALLQFERVDDEQFHAVGDHGSLIDAAANADGHAIAVGSLVDGQDGSLRPLVVESSDGATWSVGRVAEQESDAYPTAVTSLPDGRFVAIGTLTTSDGVDPALWWRSSNGQWSEPMIPDTLSSEGVEDTRSIAAGPAGVMATGLLDGRPTIWTSADGEEWAVATPSIDQSSSIAAAVVGDRFVVILDEDDGQLPMLTSDDGTDFTDQGAFGESDEREVHDAAYVEGRYIAVGGRRRSVPDGDLNPAAWSSADGVSWSAGADLPHDPELQTNRGAWADSISAGSGGAAISSSSGHRLWTSTDGRRFALMADSKPTSISLGDPVVMASATPTLVASERLFGLGGGEWTERSPGVVPTPERSPWVSEVTHGPNGFVAVGGEVSPDDAERDGTTSVGVVWRSDDGRAWERMPADPDLAGSDLAAVSTYAGGYVAVGTGYDGDIDRVGRIFVSPDGTEWTTVPGDGLEPEGGGVHQLEGVAPYGAGFIATGYGFDGTDIVPLMLVSADGTTVRRAEAAGDGAEGRPDLITLGACGPDEMAVVVGIDSGGADGYATAWSSDDGLTWEQWRSSSEVGTLRSCATSAGGRTLAAAEVGRAERAAVAELAHGSPIELEELPGVGAAAQEAEALAWIGEVPILVGRGEDDPSGGATVWIAPDDSSEWSRLAGGPLGGPGNQHAYGVATDGRTIVVAGTGPEGGAIWTTEWSAAT